ncbi:winged helix-turn-helix transcriptional regulator [archaeon]|jgi:sugar-specific transcriptional regulator TrmB|nr:winged helix-turn-helix transcriptional regulator [archaeon]MBT4396702.1 winged helix-turn-helix transcriptional regulator [archaeon]MBT4441312.1 winged helix-turn-helix transcriptional regulator [archaeon]
MSKEILIGLGLTKNEVNIYYVLLSASEITVNEISSKSGLHRQVCYDALDRLQEKGFVSYITKNNKKYFSPLEPKKILDIIETQKNDIIEILPGLEKLYKREKQETAVEVLKGKSVLKTVLRTIITTLKKTKEPLLGIGIDEARFLEHDSIMKKQYLRELKTYKIKEKLIAYKNVKTFFNSPNTEYRIFDEDFYNPHTTLIFKDRVIILIWGSLLTGIIIKNKDYANTNKKYFNKIWRNSKKLPK